MRTSQFFKRHSLTIRCLAITLTVLLTLPLSFCILTINFGNSFQTKQSQQPYDEIPPYTPSSFPS
ncbi:MAG: hypothetical protein ACTSXW_03565, partial [Candidatus Baldrarchaeia archaeon]